MHKDIQITRQFSERIRTILDQIMESFLLPGLAVGIVYQDEIVFAQGFGVKSVITGNAVTCDSLFHLASISKTFVATAILQLVESGHLSLEASLTTYIPDFKMADDRYRSITLRQMLSHTSGLPDIEEYLFDQPEVDDLALQRFVYSLGDKELVFAPGEKFFYSNTAYDILGYLIAQVSKVSFESYIEEHILRPLGMVYSTFLKSQVSPGLATSPHLSLPEVEVSPVYPYQRAHAPSGSLHSSVLELGNWAIANLKRGVFNGKQILEPDSHALLWQPVTSLGDDDPETLEGLSWFIGRYKGYQTFSHSGGDVGFCTNMVLLPEKSIAIIVLTNTFPAPVKEISSVLLDLFLGCELQLPKPLIITRLNQVLKNQGQEAALVVYCQLMNDLPNQYDIRSEQFCDTGYILTEIKRVPEAIRILELGIKIHPKADDIYSMLAFANFKFGRRELAITYAERCLDLNPKNREAMVLLKEVGQG
jgi:CubicO group peptidase (beta-lactamase class C family)